MLPSIKKLRTGCFSCRFIKSQKMFKTCHALKNKQTKKTKAKLSVNLTYTQYFSA